MSLELKLPPSSLNETIARHGFYEYVKQTAPHRISDEPGVEFDYDKVLNQQLSKRKRKKQHKGFKGAHSLL